MGNNLLTIEVDEKTYKSVKKNKRSFFLTTKEVLNKDTKRNDEVRLTTEIIKDGLETKIKDIYTKDDLNKLNKRLKNKGQFDFIKESDKLIVVEFATKKKLITKLFTGLLLILIAIILLISGYTLITNAIDKSNNDKIKKEIEKVSSEITYVIIEINPSIILELKDGKVISTGCLNEDCLTIFKDVDLINKDIKEATSKLYEEAKNKNIDVSNGVQVKSTNKEVEKQVKDLDYVKYENIEKEKEKEHLNNVLDNKDLKEEKNKNEISNDILAVYKNDKDYGKLYECKVVDSAPACYITSSFAKKLRAKNETIGEFMTALNEMHKLENVLDKFKIDYERGGVEGMSDMVVNRIAVNGTSYPLYSGLTYATSVVSANPEEDLSNKSTHSEYYRAGIEVYNIQWDDEFSGRIHIEMVPLERIELITGTYKESDKVIIKDENGYLVVTND